MNKHLASRILRAALCWLVLEVAVGTAGAQETNRPFKVTLKPTQSTPKDPSLLFLTASPAFKGGELIYGDYARVGSPKGLEWTPFLKRSPTGIATSSRNLAVFRMQGAPKSFDPQFSPDGQWVMFKAGNVGDRYDQYQLCFWNRATNQVQSGPNGLIYPRTYWSPNSHYVAYIDGGDGEGNSDPRGHLRLLIYDVKTRRSRFVAQNPMVRLLTWTAQNTLLYTVQQKPEMGRGLEPNRSAGADIYAASASGGTPKLFIPNGFDPQISADGKKVAFWSWPETVGAEATREQQQLGLYLYDREQKKRTPLRWPFSHLQSVGLRWMPDSRRLVTLQTVQRSPKARVQVAILDTANATLKNLTILQANDVEAAGRISTEPQFRPLDISHDGRFLFVKFSEFFEGDALRYVERISLQAVDLSTGKVFIGARIKTSLGVDWRAAK